MVIKHVRGCFECNLSWYCFLFFVFFQQKDDIIKEKREKKQFADSTPPMDHLDERIRPIDCPLCIYTVCSAYYAHHNAFHCKSNGFSWLCFNVAALFFIALPVLNTNCDKICIRHVLMMCPTSCTTWNSHCRDDYVDKKEAGKKKRKWKKKGA